MQCNVMTPSSSARVSKEGNRAQNEKRTTERRQEDEHRATENERAVWRGEGERRALILPLTSAARFVVLRAVVRRECADVARATSFGCARRARGQGVSGRWKTEDGRRKTEEGRREKKKEEGRGGRSWRNEEGGGEFIGSRHPPWVIETKQPLPPPTRDRHRRAPHHPRFVAPPRAASRAHGRHRDTYRDTSWYVCHRATHHDSLCAARRARGRRARSTRRSRAAPGPYTYI